MEESSSARSLLKNKLLKLFPVLIGVISISFQVVLLRLTFILFYGNELASGIFLSLWLLWTGIGSFLANFFIKKIKNKINILNFSLFILSILLILTYILSIFLRKNFSPLLGEILPLGKILSFCLIILSGVCLSLGFNFSLSCYVYPHREKDKKIGFSYLLESVGSAIGGIIFGYIIIQKIGILSLCIFLAILVSVYNIIFNKKNRILLFNVTFLCIYFFLLFLSPKLNVKFFSLLLPGYRILELRDTKYSNIQVVERHRQISFLENGILSFSLPQRLESEIIHLVISQLPILKRVLLIGTKGGQMIREILKYAPERIDIVELDIQKLKLIKKYSRFKRYYEDKRVNIFIGDGVNFVRNASTKYDCIILNISEPVSLSFNRFYTQEFFREAKKILNIPGIISFKLSSQENYINKELSEYLRVIKNTLESIFEEVIVYPGQNAIFIGCTQKGIFSQRSEEIFKKLTQKKITLRYLNEAYLSQRLSEERISYLKERLEKAGLTFLNKDFVPICFWLDIVYFSQQFRDVFRKVFKKINRNFLFKLFIFLSLGIFLISFIFFDRKKLILMSLCATGFSEMSFQIIILLFFQILYGYLYYMIGAVFGSYMTGLFVGGYLFLKRNFKNLFFSYLKIQLSICFYPLILLILTFFLKNISIHLFIEKFIFLLLPFTAGFLGSAQYITANKILTKEYKDSESWGPVTYSVDLLGSSFGALGVSIFFIPICGLVWVCILLFFLNILIFFSLLKY